jgi:hypothetical protein
MHPLEEPLCDRHHDSVPCGVVDSRVKKGAHIGDGHCFGVRTTGGCYHVRRGPRGIEWVDREGIVTMKDVEKHARVALVPGGPALSAAQSSDGHKPAAGVQVC